LRLLWLIAFIAFVEFIGLIVFFELFALIGLGGKWEKDRLPPSHASEQVQEFSLLNFKYTWKQEFKN
jgi:hypothetical protein